MSALNLFALLLLVEVIRRTWHGVRLRIADRRRRGVDRTGTDTGALPRVNRRKPFTAYTP